jgi:WD40 repeat protein/serine/threonine protein kinase
LHSQNPPLEIDMADPVPSTPERPPGTVESSSCSAAPTADPYLDALPPAPPALSPNPPGASSESLGEGLPNLSGYEILGVLGRGGMGIVYKARHLLLKRIVALKMSRPGDVAGEEERARFRAEAEAVARLRHPNIVQIYEVGEHQGRLFFSFEYAEGGSLADALKGKPQPPRASALLLETLALAMQAVHQQGIVHRDLKPANVLLTGGKAAFTDATEVQPARQAPAKAEDTATLPGFARVSAAMPKITDFGIAKRLDTQSIGTATGAVIGTPNYMAPEQAWGHNRRRPVGPPADIYALGAILYEMLTGRPPFVGETPLDTLQQVISQDPVAPTRLQPKIPRDLETICLKCLHKEPARRYLTAADLADDLRRFLEDRPIVAQPAGPLTRFQRWYRRHPAIAVMVAILAVVLLSATAVSTYFAIEATAQAKKALQEAERADQEAEHALLEKARADKIAEANREIAAVARKKQEEAEEKARLLKKSLEVVQAQKKETQDRERQLDIARERADEKQRDIDLLRYWMHMRVAQGALERHHVAHAVDVLVDLLPHKTSHYDFRDFEWHYLGRCCGSALALRDAQHSLMEATAWRKLGPIQAMTWSAEARMLATAHAVLNERGPTMATEIRLWRYFQGGEQLATLPRAHAHTITRLVFDPSGRRLASASLDGTVSVWDVNQQTPVFTYKGHAGPVACVDFNHDGTRLVSCSADGSVHLWSLAKDSPKPLKITKQPAKLRCVAFHPDGKTVAVACGTGVLLFDAAGGQKLQTLTGEPATEVLCLAFHPRLNELAAGSADGTVRLWDLATGKVRATLAGHSRPVTHLAFAADGQQLAGLCDDGTLRLWHPGGRLRVLVHEHGPAPMCGLTFGPGGTLVMTACPNRIMVRATGMTPAVLACPVHADGVKDLTWSHDGQWLAMCGGPAGQQQDGKGEIWLRNTASGAMVSLAAGHSWHVNRLAFQPRGMLLATGSQDGTVVIRDVVTKKELPTFPRSLLAVQALCWHPEGSALATAGKHGDRGKWVGQVTIWEPATGNKLLQIPEPDFHVTSLAWSPNGKWLAGGCEQNSKIIVWDARTGDRVRVFDGHQAQVVGLAFSPDSRFLASASLDDTARYWEVEGKASQAIFIFKGHTAAVLGVAFHKDGNRLATCSADHSIKLWDLTIGQDILTLTGHDAPVASLAFRPDGYQLASASLDGTVRVWDGTPIQEKSAVRPRK